MFIDKNSDSEFCKKVLKVLRKLNEHLPELVCEQFQTNLKFPQAVINYMVNTPMEEMAGDAFICFVNIYDDMVTPKYVTT